MNLKEETNSFSNFSFQIKINGMNYSSKEVVASMSNGFIDYLETSDNQGLRNPQYGALCSIRSYWTIGEESITIVLPTGDNAIMMTVQ